jgi:hypothetical protein
MLFPLSRLLVVALIGLGLGLGLAPAAVAAPAENLLLITYDGLRWQEVFGGLDQSIMSADTDRVGEMLALAAQSCCPSSGTPLPKRAPSSATWKAAVPPG